MRSVWVVAVGVCMSVCSISAVRARRAAAKDLGNVLIADKIFAV